MSEQEPAGSRRPGLLGQLRYTLGGRLPRNVEWVRHDLTDAGWQIRLVARLFLPLVPVVVIAALLPLPGIGLHVMMALLVVLSWALTVPLYVEQVRNRRLRQHGLPPPPEQGPYRTYG